MKLSEEYFKGEIELIPEERKENISQLIIDNLNLEIAKKNFSNRYLEKIYRAEIEKIRKKFNNISLGVSISLVIIISILIIIQRQLELFSDNLIPILIIPIVFVLLTIGITEFFLMRKLGSEALEKRMGNEEEINRRIDQIKKIDFGSYKICKDAFLEVRDLERDSLLPGFALKVLLSFSNFDKEIISYNELFKALFFLSFGKRNLLKTEIIKSDSDSTFFQEIIKLLKEYKLLLVEIKSSPIVPIYFILKINKILDFLEKAKLDDLVLGNENNFEVLEFIIRKANKKNLNWVLVGSTNLAVQGLKIKAKDIDILATKTDAEKITSMLSKYQTKTFEYSESEKYRSWFGKFEIDNVKIELMAELEFKNKENEWIKSESLEKKTYIEFRGQQLPVIPLQNEKKFYMNMNRESDIEKIKLIDDYNKEN